METSQTLFTDSSQFCLGNNLQYIGNPVPTAKQKKEQIRNQRLGELNDFIQQEGNGKVLRREVFGYIRKYIGGNYHDTDDIMIDVQVQVWTNRDKYDAFRCFRPWLFTLATNCCIDYQRKNKRHRRMVRLDDANTNKVGDESEECCYGDILEAPLQRTAEDNEECEIVRRSLSMLPENSRQVVELIYFQGYKYRETAETLGIPEGTVKSRLHAAILHLRESPLIKKLNGAA